MIDILQPEMAVSIGQNSVEDNKKQVAVNLPSALLCNKDNGNITWRGVIVSEAGYATEGRFRFP